MARHHSTDRSGSQSLAEIEAPNAMGILQEDVPMAHQLGSWVQDQSLLVRMLQGHLSSASTSAVLQGLNRLWVECDDGAWEQIGFATATLVAPKTYRLTQLLRGLHKTQFAARQPSIAGGRVLVAGDTKALNLSSELVGRQPVAICLRWPGKRGSYSAQFHATARTLVATCARACAGQTRSDNARSCRAVGAMHAVKRRHVAGHRCAVGYG